VQDKKQVIAMLQAEFKRWVKLLAGMSEEQISAPHLPSNLSIKDVMAHLWAWQQRSIARLEAALLDMAPEYPDWPADLDPEQEGQPHQLNAWIYETYREKPWPSVYRDWRAGFLRFLELGQAIPEPKLFETGKYPWLDGYALSDVLLGSYRHHHQEHLEPLLDWLEQQSS
jgi:hypothetical protein